MDIPSESIKYFYQFIKGEISEEKYFSEKEEHGPIGDVPFYWPELYLVKEDMDLFRTYLLKLSVEGRFKILLTCQLLGMSGNGLKENYGIAKDKLRTFKGQYHPSRKNPKAKIRQIIGSQSISNELYATLAVFMRVPVSWIQEKVPEPIWSVEHFKHLPDASLSFEEFKDYLITAEQNAIKSWKPNQHRIPTDFWFYDINGFILKVNNSHTIYIRVAVYEDAGFIIEVFKQTNEMYDFTILKEFLAPFEPIQTGYFETVIKERINPVIICKSRSKNFKLPTYLKSF
ncbi:hypothetical protein RCG17_22820 [Neobacillus sp. PS3-12]|uniref:hypothetical protein n=1 Tax=Neobacillus sp. PS3-12 TaxID=3070677 RepID=UPI0027E0650F|nr:hypothetical protein [Neobacillus sp. PS3-12]WML52193.1 hypothetical protein RCG17_22820 [Neobacillus sp. PS3-12]